MKSRYTPLALVYLVLAIGVGYLLSQQLSDFLGISINPKELPQVQMPVARQNVGDLNQMQPFEAIVLPAGKQGDERYQRAGDELAAAIAYRTGVEPAQVEMLPNDDVVRTIRVEDQVEIDSEVPESYVLKRLDDEGSVGIEAADELGAVYGMYYLAAQLKAGADVLTEEDVQTIAPAMEFRLVDLGGVGVVADEEAWRAHDYSHHLRAFEDVILADAPYIDELAMAQVNNEFREYIQRMIAFGYNGIIFDGFLEYIDFDKVGSGYDVYPVDSEYRRRHAAMRDAFGGMLAYADEMGMQVIFKTDMLVFSDPLASYLEETVGDIDATDPALWAVYRQGVAELFERFPFIDGLMIRIGEAGSIYNLEGWDYYSSLDVRTDEAVKMMLQQFSNAAAEYEKTIFFRSWSVGIGEVGNMHTDPETYERLLGDIEAPNLVVSTKYTMGDYYSFLPLNPTLKTGNQRRIIEFQARREFEAFNAFPNYMGPTHQLALQELSQANPNIEGIWVWTQGGGPQRAGPWSLYPFNGFWQTYDDTVYATAQLAWDPAVDIQDLTEAWIRLTLSDDPGTVNKLAQMAYLSREATLKGLYIGEFAAKQILAMGLEPPPQFWIFEWDIVSGSNSALSAVYTPVSDNLEAAVSEGFEAVDLVRQMRQLVGESDPASFYQPELHQSLLDSLAYQVNLFETLAFYRQAFLNYYHWLDTGDSLAYQQWQQAYDHFVEVKENHILNYGNDLDFPAYNFFAVDAGMAHASRSNLMMWLARFLLLIMVGTLLAGTRLIQDQLPDFPGKVGLRGLWVALTMPWNLGNIEPRSRANLWVVSLWPLLLILAGRLLFSSFLSTAYLVLVLLLLVPFYITLLILNRERNPFHIWATINSPILAMVILPITMTAIRGPIYYWYQFWMEPQIRTIYIVVAVAVSSWSLLVFYLGQRAAYMKARLVAVSNLFLAMSASLILLGAVISLIGLEESITAINDELAILPLGLSRILGITTHLEIPTTFPQYIIIFGAVLLVAGVFLSLVRSPRQAAP